MNTQNSSTMPISILAEIAFDVLIALVVLLLASLLCIPFVMLIACLGALCVLVYAMLVFPVLLVAGLHERIFKKSTQILKSAMQGFKRAACFFTAIKDIYEVVVVDTIKNVYHVISVIWYFETHADKSSNSKET